MSRSDESPELESAMVWNLLRIATIPVGLCLLVWYGLLLFGFHAAILSSLPVFVGALILLPFTIQLSAKGTLARMEAAWRLERKLFFFWQILWQNFLLLNMIIIICLYKFRAPIGRLLRPLVDSSFVRSHHFMILLVLALSIVGYTVRYVVRMERLDWEMIDRLKAVSVVSPAYCFGGAAIWSKVLAPFDVSKEQNAVLIRTSIIAGVMFLVFFLLQALLRPKNLDASDQEEGSLVDHSGKPLKKNTEKVTFPLYATTFTVALGLSAFFAVVFDAAYLVLR